MTRLQTVVMCLSFGVLSIASSDKAFGYANLLCDSNGCSVGFADSCGLASSIPDNTVGEAKLVDGAVTASKLGVTCAEGQYLQYVTPGVWSCGTVVSDTLVHTFGTNNFFAGGNAGNLTMTGVGNTASGFFALFSNTEGIGNTAIGAEALYFNTTGNYNTASGKYALSSNITGDYNTASGTSALILNTAGYGNTASGGLALFGNTTGVCNTAGGLYALSSNTIGGYNTAVGCAADVASGDLVNATTIGYGAIVDASNHVRIGNAEVTQIGGQVAWSNLSDMRQKEDIQEIGYGLDFIKSLRPVEFRMKNGNYRLDFGFIAQEIEALLGTQYNLLGIGGDSDRMLSLRYTDFIAPMVKAMQEQQTVIETQKDKIDDLEARLARLEALLSGR